MTDPDLQISGGLGQSQLFFGNIGPHGLKIRAPPRPLPWIHHCFFNDKRIVFGPISILDLICAVFKQGLFYKGPLGEIAWVEPFLWDLITFMFAVTATIKLKLPMGRKTRARFHGERRCKQWKVTKSWNVFDHFRINFKYTVSFYLLSNREHKASCLKIAFFPKTISNFFHLVASVIGINKREWHL